MLPWLLGGENAIQSQPCRDPVQKLRQPAIYANADAMWVTTILGKKVERTNSELSVYQTPKWEYKAACCVKSCVCDCGSVHFRFDANFLGLQRLINS